MPTAKPTVILTRPAESAADFARGLGGDARIILSPIIDIRPLAPPPDLKRYGALVVTSQAALAGFADGALAGHLVFAVGDRSAARAAGLGADTRSAGGDAEDLARLIIAERPVGRLLYLRGREVARDLAEMLNSAGLETDTAIVYEQAPRPLTGEALAALQAPGRVILPVFSPRSARLLGAAVTAAAAAATLELVAISPRAAAAWTGPEPALSLVASRPDFDAMLAAVRDRLPSGP